MSTVTARLNAMWDNCHVRNVPVAKKSAKNLQKCLNERKQL